jgi:hypothetical protein
MKRSRYNILRADNVFKKVTLSFLIEAKVARVWQIRGNIYG